MHITKEQILEVMKITGKAETNAAKYLKSVVADLEEDGAVEWEDVLDVIKMENKVKVNKIKNCVQSEEKTKTKNAKPKTVKVSDVKKRVFATIAESLKAEFGENVEITKENKLIFVNIDGKSIKIDVIETRNK